MSAGLVWMFNTFPDYLTPSPFVIFHELQRPHNSNYIACSHKYSKLMDTAEWEAIITYTHSQLRP